MVRLRRLEQSLAQPVTILGKIEWLNPGGSDRDRVALAAIEAAEAAGILTPESTIIEPTSGNIGFSLALVCAARGYRLILTMPDIVPQQRVQLLRTLGAEVVLTPAMRGMQGAITRAKALLKSTPNSWMVDQFENPATVAAHEATGEEIWSQTEGSVDVLVSGVGTGGLITGAGRALKARNPAVRIVAVQPMASPVLTGGAAGSHRLFGIGAPFVPPLFDASVVDQIIDVSDKDAYATMRRLMREEGLFGGPSSGAAVAAALELAQQADYRDATIVVVLPDSIERYAGADIFSER